jgi:hypothetical protein
LRCRRGTTLSRKSRKSAGRHAQVEAVGGAVHEPAFDFIRDGFGAADEGALPAAQRIGGLSQGVALFGGDADDLFGVALVAVERDAGEVGEGRVELVLAEVVIVEGAAQLDQQFVEIERFFRLARDAAGFLIRVGQRGGEAGEHLDMVGIAAKGGGAAFQVGVIFDAALDVLRRGEGAIGDAGAKVAAGAGIAGLEDDRLTLTRAAERQRSGDAEMRALVVEAVLFALVEELAGRAVAGKASSS